MLSEKAINNLHKVWLVAENEYKVEVNGHLRENDIPVILKAGSRKEVIPDCDIAYKYITFHTHPQKNLDYEERLIWGKMVPTLISGPDIAQLWGCNAEDKTVPRTELVVGEFGVVEATMTQESADFYSNLSMEHRRLFEWLVECNGYLYGYLFDFSMIPTKRLNYQLAHIDNRLLMRILNDDEDLEIIKSNPDTLGEKVRGYLDAYNDFKDSIGLPQEPYKLIDLNYYWYDGAASSLK